jgi:flagellar hook protein FlgE
VTEDGFVTGSFTNGESKKLFKLVIGVFQDPNRLDAVSANLFRETDASGRPLFKQAGIGGTANVASGSLEQSTVDIANEFSNMIVSQRAFQASSKIVSTVDQMLNELLQLR